MTTEKNVASLFLEAFYKLSRSFILCTNKVKMIIENVLNKFHFVGATFRRIFAHIAYSLNRHEIGLQTSYFARKTCPTETTFDRNLLFQTRRCYP